MTPAPYAFGSQPRRIAAHIGYLFTELPLVDRFSAARDAGFEAVDLSDIARHPLDDILTGMRRSGLPLLQTTAAAGSRDRRGPGLAALPGREQEFRAGCGAVLPYVEATGLRFVHVTSGIPGPEVTFEQSHATYCDNLRFALDLLAPHRVVVLIEPINSIDLPGYFMHTLALARQVIAGIGYDDLKLLFDVYHLAMSSLDPAQAFRDSWPDIGHIQLADHPGRHEPGTGTVDFAALVDAAVEADYQGWFSAEYLPLGATNAGLKWLAPLRLRYADQAGDRRR
jgi:hydroxypyruvate isomerase